MKRRTINALTGVVIMAALEVTACQYTHQYQREDITTTSIEQEETTEVETMTIEETTTENETTTVEETTKETTTIAEIPTTTETEIETTTVEDTIAETLPPEPVTEPPVIIEPTLRYIFSEEDTYYLLKTASCEAGNQGVYGMALIMRVVINRAEQWGMSIHDVLYQPDQFNCVYGDWWVQDYYAEGVHEALELVRNGWDESYGATFFCTPARNEWHMTHLVFLFQYGNMQFYKENLTSEEWSNILTNSQYYQDLKEG